MDLSSLPTMSDNAWVNAAASAAAGIISRIFTHPLDTAKARLQAVYIDGNTNGRRHLANPYRGPFDALLQTARKEGVKGLYRGFGAVIVGGTPATMAYLGTYDYAKERLSNALSGDDGEPASDLAVHFSSGMIAETFVCIVYVPVDVVKERMQVQRQGANLAAGYRNSWDALVKITRNEGFSGIYRGYAATLASFGPFSALYFVFYERFKFWTRQYVTGRTDESLRSLDKVELPFQWVLLSSAGAGALASWLTSPLDLAKLRLQVSRGAQATSADTNAIVYRGVLDCLQHVYREGGVKGLFRGAGARVLHFCPATTITMTSYETCRSMINRIISSG